MLLAKFEFDRWFHFCFVLFLCLFVCLFVCLFFVTGILILENNQCFSYSCDIFPFREDDVLYISEGEPYQGKKLSLMFMYSLLFKI